MDEQNKTLSWFKWQIRDIKSYREVFTNEQMGELFFAVMETAESGEKVNVSAAIRLAYLQMCNDIEVARAAYIKKCEQNAKNGAKGGRAKAENAKDNKKSVYKEVGANEW